MPLPSASLVPFRKMYDFREKAMRSMAEKAKTRKSPLWYDRHARRGLFLHPSPPSSTARHMGIAKPTLARLRRAGWTQCTLSCTHTPQDNQEVLTNDTPAYDPNLPMASPPAQVAAALLLLRQNGVGRPPVGKGRSCHIPSLKPAAPCITGRPALTWCTRRTRYST